MGVRGAKAQCHDNRAYQSCIPYLSISQTSLMKILSNAEHDTFNFHSTVKGKLNLKTVSEEMIVYTAVQSDSFNLEQYNKKLTKVFINSINENGDTQAKETIEFYTIEVLKLKIDEDQEEVDDDDNKSITNRNCDARIKDCATTAADEELDDHESNVMS
ncbi:hypothetical protein ARMGADRAFT_1038910 [Armillaria gallica]|uniref:Uncharacterized protein n=1 Tax=Armillaria gallica TaxID=47427 RepID=A0A2H3D3D1_ARMGA|nr:hypothetical protein ARMGADRAFT_1038910 [Armillaria gallica]